MDSRISIEPPSHTDRFLFVQALPRLGNSYVEDSYLRSTLRQLLPPDASTEGDLVAFGGRCATSLLRANNDCETNHPVHQAYDTMGSRVDYVHTPQGWKDEHAAAAEEGLIALPYERVSPFARVHQFAKLLMFCPSSGMYSCPLAMTDGAARLMQQLLRSHHLSLLSSPTSGSTAVGATAAAAAPASPLSPAAAAAAAQAFSHLTSRSPVSFWTSGQWMTEQRSGSDVSAGTATLALAHPDGTYRLHGLKWFTSAIDAAMAVVLARIVPPSALANPLSPEVARVPLSCFLVLLRDPLADVKVAARAAAAAAGPLPEPGSAAAAAADAQLPPAARADGLNGIRVRRLKDKLGTRSLPTAELDLAGTRALLLSAPGRGVATISTLFNVTRLHNTISALGYTRRSAALARDYAHRRRVFGRSLAANPLQVETLAAIEASYRPQLRVALELALLQGAAETFDAVAFAAARTRAEGAAGAGAAAEAEALCGLRPGLVHSDSGDRKSTGAQEKEELEAALRDTMSVLARTFWPPCPAAAASAPGLPTAPPALSAVSARGASARASALLRLLTPLAKLHTAKSAVADASEGIEALGALGYVEDSHVPSVLRNAQVLSIWEGTTNVCSHDVLRVLVRNTAAAGRRSDALAAASAASSSAGAPVEGRARVRVREGEGEEDDAYRVFELVVLSRAAETLAVAGAVEAAAEAAAVAAGPGADAGACTGTSAGVGRAKAGAWESTALHMQSRLPVVGSVSAAEAAALPSPAALRAAADAICGAIAGLRAFLVASRLSLASSFAPLPPALAAAAAAAGTGAAAGAGVAALAASSIPSNLPRPLPPAAAAHAQEARARDLAMCLFRIYAAAAAAAHACRETEPLERAAAWAVALRAAAGGAAAGCGIWGAGTAVGAGLLPPGLAAVATEGESAVARAALTSTLLGLDVGPQPGLTQPGRALGAGAERCERPETGHGAAVGPRGWGDQDPVTGMLRATLG